MNFKSTIYRTAIFIIGIIFIFPIFPAAQTNEFSPQNKAGEIQINFNADKAFAKWLFASAKKPNGNLFTASGTSFFNEKGFHKPGKDNLGILPLIPPVAFKQFDDDSIPPGAFTNLRLGIINLNNGFRTVGGGFLAGLELLDPLPDGMSVVSLVSTTELCGAVDVTVVPNTNFIRVFVPFMLPGASCVVTVAVKAVKPGVKFNQTTPVTSGGLTGNIASDSITVACPLEFKVDNPNDTFDPNLGDGLCGTNSFGTAGGCTLRAAIDEVKVLGNVCPNVPIRFLIPMTVNLTQLNPLSVPAGRTVKITGFGASLTTINGNGTTGVFVNNGTLELNGLTITGGFGANGNGLRNTGTATINNSVITENSAVIGGGIYSTGGTLNLNRTTVSDNTADQAGGIYSEDTTTNISNSTISGNSGISGEGLRNVAVDGNAIMTLVNSTVSGNTTQNENSAIRTEAATGFTSTLNLTNVTVTNNQTTNAGQNAALWVKNSGGTNNVSLRNTILSGNTSGGNFFDIEGNVNATSSFNLIGTGGNLTNGVNNNQVGINNPLLAPLANNTGLTRTHALLTNSPAIDKGFLIGGLITDQRGSPRPVDNPGIPNPVGGNGSDIGAFELNSVTAPPNFASEDSAVFQTNTFGSFTVTTYASPAATIILSGVLPSGVTFVDNGNGTATFSGTPAANAGGIYNLVLTANNGVNPFASQNFTLTVASPLSFTSAPNATFLVGSANSFTFSTSGAPAPAVTRISGNLPPGPLFTDNGNGTATLSGIPVAGSGGNYVITVSASNGISEDIFQSFSLTVNEAPVIVSPNAAGFLAGSPGFFRVETNGFPRPVTLSLSGTLPNNVTFDAATGVFSGTPDLSALGDYPLTIQAVNGISPGFTQNFNLKVCATANVEVTNLANSGAGSLRQALIEACPGSTITFAPSVSGQVNFNGFISIDKDITIQGPGADQLTFRGTGDRVFIINSGRTVKISGVTISNGFTSFDGGAIFNSGNLTLEDAVVSNSQAGDGGGGIYNGGTLNVVRSTISGNSGFSGGGIYSPTGTLNLINSTVSGNTSLINGGGIYAAGTINIINCTIANNRADFDNNNSGSGGGVYNNNIFGPNPSTMRNTLVVNNFLRQSFANPVVDDVSGAFTNTSNNFIGFGTFSVSAILDTTLALNSGKTPTHSIPPNSPVIDQGGAVDVLSSFDIFSDEFAPLTTDQRGFMRPVDNPLIANAGDGSDIGAFEVQAPSAANVSIGGRVFAENRGLFNAKVYLQRQNGEIRVANTNQFGFYNFNGVESGEVYVVRVVAKRHRFTPQVLTVSDNVSDLNFYAENF